MMTMMLGWSDGVMDSKKTSPFGEEHQGILTNQEH